MIQQLLNSAKTFWVKSDKYVIILMLLIFYIFSNLIIRYHFTDINSLNQLLSNLFQFSGIFSAIVITYVISKVFQIRQERLEKGKDIIKLANKVTDFRRIARILVNSHGFWNSEMKAKINLEYSDLNYFHVHYWDYDNEDKYPEIKMLRDKYFNEESIPGADLYLAMRALVSPEDKFGTLELYSQYDYDHVYTVEILEHWVGSHVGNRLYYCFKYKWGNYKTCFDFSQIRLNDREEIQNLASKIDSAKFSGKDFDKNLLADIGTDMDGFYLPRLYSLSYYNSLPLSPTLNFLLSILFITILSGVLAPLILTSIIIPLNILIIISSISVTILFLSLFYFVLKFKKILNSEIEM